jgi:branched-chain amino acid transport system permease protein
MKRGHMLAALLAALLVLPFAIGGTRYETYTEHVIVQMLLLGLLAMSWDFLFGFLGMFSFGHAAFFGIAGYVAAMLVVHAGVGPWPLALLGAVAAAGSAGLAIGYLCARVGSVAVFLVTFACAEAIYLLVISNPFNLTNGDNGLLGVLAGAPFPFDLRNQRSFYYLAIATLAGSYLVLRAVAASQFGQVLRAIRDNEERVRFAGYEVTQYKSVAFGISGIFAGLAGALTTFHERIASPDSLSWATSGEAVLFAVVGGTGTLLGPVFGAALIILVREVLSDHIRSWLIFVGLAYLALIFFLPGGLYSLFTRKPRASA